MPQEELIDFGIELHGEKLLRTCIDHSSKIDKLRVHLTTKNISLPAEFKFLDQNGFPISKSDEINILVTELISKTSHPPTIHIVGEESKLPKKISTSYKVGLGVIVLSIALFYHQVLIKNYLCPSIDQWNSNIATILNCEIIKDNRTNTTEYLSKEIANNPQGDKSFEGHGGDLIEEKDIGNTAVYYRTMYADWLQKEAIYKEDYEWYNNMKSTDGNCQGFFEERVSHSTKLIFDTPEAINEFVKSEVQDWPLKIKDKIKLETQLEGLLDENDDGFSLKINGKIQSNLYLIAWRREDSNKIRIQTHITIFERNAGENCRFNEDYWNSQRDRISNAKKYYLLIKIRSNPIYKNYLLGSNVQ